MGGLESRLHNYVEWLTSRGHEVTLLCQRFDPKVSWPQGTKQVRLSAGLTPKVLRNIMYNRKLSAYMKENSFDLSISMQRTWSQDAVLAASNHRGYMQAMKKKIWWPGDYAQDLLERRAYAHAKVLFACSEMIRKNISELMPRIDSSKIRILHPPVNEKRFRFAERKSEERRLLRKKLEMKDDAKTFLFISSSHYRKGLDILLKAFSELKNEPVNLFIIGSPEVKAKSSNVRYIGYTREVEAYYQAADFTIHPARYEPFGQVISESLQCGTPVLISHFVGAKEILTNEEGVVVPSFLPAEWTKMIREVKPEQFHVLPDYAVRKKLTLNDHMNFLLEETLRAIRP